MMIYKTATFSILAHVNARLKYNISIHDFDDISRIIQN